MPSPLPSRTLLDGREAPWIVSSLSNQADVPLAYDYDPSLHLVLHFDINETVLIEDEAGGDTREDIVNKMLAKAACVQIPHGVDSTDTHSITPTHWWDGSEIGTTRSQPPPLYTGWQWPDGCCPYYRTAFKKRSKTFIEHDGSLYRPLHDILQERLQPRFEDHKHAILSHILPALFETLVVLTKRKQTHTIVFRTFGSDLVLMAEAVSAFAQGQHPDYPDFYNKDYILTQSNLFRGKWREVDNELTYELYNHNNQDDHQRCCAEDSAILNRLHSCTICGIQDDYPYWNAHNYEPWAGKPVWGNTALDHHHILLDDNIHNVEHDSIACVRMLQADGTFRTLSGSEIQQQQGLHLIRVPTIQVVLDPHWFLNQIDRAVMMRRRRPIYLR